MTRQEVFNWYRQQYGAELEFPWTDREVVLCHAYNRKKDGCSLANFLILQQARCSVTEIESIPFFKIYSPAFASSSSRAISPRTSENATSFRPLLVTTSA